MLSYETALVRAHAYLYACTLIKALVPCECGLTAQFLLVLNILFHYCLLLLTSRRPHKHTHNLCCHAANARAQVEENHLLCHSIAAAADAAAAWPRREHGLGELPHTKRCHLPIRELNAFLGSTPPRYLPRPERSQDLVCELPVFCTDSWREGGLSERERERERESERAREIERLRD